MFVSVNIVSVSLLFQQTSYFVKISLSFISMFVSVNIVSVSLLFQQTSYFVKNQFILYFHVCLGILKKMNASYFVKNQLLFIMDLFLTHLIFLEYLNI